MGVLNVNWGDGSGQLLSFDPDAGNGDASVKVSSVLNEGLDRSRKVYVSVGSVTRALTVNQPGLREVFNASDGEFTTFDGYTINALK